jgi:rubrerythrin
MQELNPLEILREAMQIEKDGIRFYKRASHLSKNKKTHDMFLRLAQDELTHLEKLELVYDNLAENNEWMVDKDLMDAGPKRLRGLDEFEADLEAGSDMDELGAIDQGIKVEEDSIRLYKAAAEDGKVVREGGHSVFKWLTDFERGHLSVLKERRKELVSSD